MGLTIEDRQQYHHNFITLVTRVSFYQSSTMMFLYLVFVYTVQLRSVSCFIKDVFDLIFASQSR